MQNTTIPRPAPALRPFPGAPEGLPASLEPLRQAYQDARQALRDARAVYEAGCAPGGDDYAAVLLLGEDELVALLEDEPRRYARWLLAAREVDRAASTLAAAASPALFDKQVAAARKILADLEALLIEVAGTVYGDDPAGRLLRAEHEMAAEGLRRDFWKADAVAAWLADPLRWRGTGGMERRTGPAAWPVGLSKDALAAALALTGVRTTTPVTVGAR